MFLRLAIATSFLALAGAITFAAVAISRGDGGCGGGIRVRFAGTSMEPSFHDGDAVRFDSFDGDLERLQVVLFRFPLDPNREFIKRVIAVPGDTVEVRDENVFVNGSALTEEYILATPNYTYGPKVVPADAYFVLGDNRRNSFDSHAWGLSCAEGSQCEFVPTRFVLGELTPEGLRASCE